MFTLDIKNGPFIHLCSTAVNSPFFKLGSGLAKPKNLIGITEMFQTEK